MYYAYSTGDTAPMESVSDLQQCKVCADVANEIEEWRSEESFLTPANLTEIELYGLPDDEWYEGRTPIFYSFNRSALEKISNSSKQKAYEEKLFETSVLLEWRDGKWIVVAAAWDPGENNA